MDAIPPNAALYLPMLVKEQRAFWPDHPEPVSLAIQVEVESCITKKHPRCWNPRSELKTPRENGVGFLQTTIAYRADGSVRFNVFEENKRLDKSLASWSWDDRYNPELQLRSGVLKNKQGYNLITGAANEKARLHFSNAAYNGGISGVNSDRLICKATKGCDPSQWFGNVEFTSNKSKVTMSGYGRSPFQINREYVREIDGSRKLKYLPYFK